MRNDEKAFPYRPPTDRIRESYKELFALRGPIAERPCKLAFDRFFSLLIAAGALPILCAICAAYIIDGIVHPEHRGSFFIVYTAATSGRRFKKYKFRVVRESLINQEARRECDIQAYPSERQPENLTCVGKFLKKYYLDELPQIYNILKGDISFVGPRPLAWEHYERDLKQGNVNRRLLKAGLFSDTHTRKGTPYFHSLELEYAYIKKYMNFPALLLLWTDIRIIARGIKMILEGRGY